MITYLVAAALLAVSSPALAKSTGDPIAVRVSYTDLDLTRAHGQATLARRLHRAVMQVCEPATILAPSAVREARLCRRFAWAEAEQALGVAIASAQNNRGEDIAAQ